MNHTALAISLCFISQTKPTINIYVLGCRWRAPQLKLSTPIPKLFPSSFLYLASIAGIGYRHRVFVNPSLGAIGCGIGLPDGAHV
ncbi:hypothetical protein V6N12_009610 [Hibiscus sabdariffa]|uniref:Uncharacterized protein n=1 Tax=Hibiscus sabdariffa TaxID=183260 RepID=A0ABR2BUE2_9ROSI